jgi:hypothetical protein
MLPFQAASGFFLNPGWRRIKPARSCSDLLSFAGCEERKSKSRRPNRLEENLLGQVGGSSSNLFVLTGT